MVLEVKMGNTWPKLIRDPVHDIISFENKPCDRLLLELINAREFQRLRRIKQLGMTEMVFPGANHSRFAHSIGVMHNARRFLVQIEQLTGKSIEDRTRTAVLTAALLHDLGHGPFSHTFEKITGESHENRTIEIIVDDSTQVNAVLKKHEKMLPEILRQFFEEDPDVDSKGGLPEHFIQIVSSQLDADRFDYLLRDAHASGADYGRFDSRWIIQHLLLDHSKRRLHLSNKAYIAAESYVFARYHMYRAVYFHKTTRAAEVMLRLLFKRYKHLLESHKSKTRVVSNAPSEVLLAFTCAGKMKLRDYLQLDDHSITEFAKACSGANDKSLESLADGLLARKLFKAIDLTGADTASVAEFVAASKDALRRKSFDPDSSFISDTPADVPYKPYDPDESKPATQIYVENSLGEAKEFSLISEAVQAMKKKYALLRYYFPSDVRADIESIAQSHIKREQRP
jgi:uncharacterized protein